METEEELLALMAGMHSDFLMKSFGYSCSSSAKQPLLPAQGIG